MKHQWSILISSILFLAINEIRHSNAGGLQPERNLADLILQNYSINYRPVHNPNTTVHVSVFPTIYGIVDLNELQESITYMIWQAYTWTDEMLAWENRTNETWFTSDFETLQEIYIPVPLIWVPDVVVFNVLEKKDIIDRTQVIASVQKNGTVKAEFPQVLTTRCQFDISEFPFDTQNCSMTYGSWSLPANDISVTTTVKLVTDVTGIVLHPNPEWDVTAITSSNRMAGYIEDASTSAVGDTFSELDITITIKRKPAYYILVLILPTFVIALINTIGLFCMKRERVEKVTMGLTTLLTLAVILNIVTNQVPKSSLGLPLIGNYILFEILLSSAGIIITVVIIFIHERMLIHNYCPPSWLLFICCIKNERLDDEKNQIVAPNFINVQATSSNNNYGNDQQQEILQMLKKYLLRHEKYSEEKRQCGILEDQWARIFLALDLIMMIIFILGNILGSLLIIYDK